MNLSSVAVIVCVFVTKICADNLELSLQQSNDPDNKTTIFKRYSLRADYGDYGLRIGKSRKTDALEVGIFHNEGRGKKDDYQMITILFGYKISTLIALTMSLFGGLALKALGLAKLALITSGIVFIQKLFHQSHEEYQYEHQRSPSFVEIEPLPEHSMPEASVAGGDYQPSSIGNFYSYDSYVPTATGSTTNQETTVVAPSNSTSNGNQQQISATKRRDIGKHKQIIPLITVHRYTVKSN